MDARQYRALRRRPPPHRARRPLGGFLQCCDARLGLALSRDVGVSPDTIKGAALLSGPYDFYPFTEQRGRDALGSWSRPSETQPINFVTPSAPPMLLATGSADEIVNPRNSRTLAAKLKAAGVSVELKIYPGKSHVDLAKSLSRLFRSTTPALADSAAFLHRVIGS